MSDPSADPHIGNIYTDPATGNTWQVKRRFKHHYRCVSRNLSLLQIAEGVRGFDYGHVEKFPHGDVDGWLRHDLPAQINYGDTLVYSHHKIPVRVVGALRLGNTPWQVELWGHFEGADKPPRERSVWLARDILLHEGYRAPFPGELETLQVPDLPEKASA